MPTSWASADGTAILAASLSTISGVVVSGDSRGKSLGFPTANLDLDDDTTISPGVYAAVVKWDAGTYQAVANFGYRPTFAGQGLVFELHLLDYEGDLYGKKLFVTLTWQLRDEIRFNDRKTLVEQIREDIRQARDWFTENEFHL